MRLIIKSALPVAAALVLAACSQPGSEETDAPETAATSDVTAQGAAPIEPSVGSPPEPGGGVPGSSDESNGAGNPDGTVADPTLPRETPNP